MSPLLIKRPGPTALHATICLRLPATSRRNLQNALKAYKELLHPQTRGETPFHYIVEGGRSVNIVQRGVVVPVRDGAVALRRAPFTIRVTLPEVLSEAELKRLSLQFH